MKKHYGYLFPLFLTLLLFFTGCSGEKKKDGIKEGVAVKEDVEMVGSTQPKESFNGLRVHFKRPDGWGEPNFYAVGEEGAFSKQYSGKWPGSKMTPEGNGWYVYTVDNVERANIVFNDGDHQIPRPDWTRLDMDRDKGEWWFDGSWHKSPPADYTNTMQTP